VGDEAFEELRRMEISSSPTQRIELKGWLKRLNVS
jgi:hypothetical protein